MDLNLAPGYHPHAKQLAFHQSPARFRVVSAGVRGGKTVSATVELLRSIYRDLAAGKGRTPAGSGRRRQPRLEYWAVAPTVPLNVYVHRYVNQFCPPELITRVYDDAIWLEPDILISFKTAERPDLLVGASVDGILVDEACRVKASAWEGALRGRIADTGGWAILASSPSGGRNNWVYQQFVARSSDTASNIGSFSWKTSDNTAVPGLAAEVESARRTMSAAFFGREFEASWDSFGGAIYEEFSDAVHVTTEDKFRFECGIPRSKPLRECFSKVISAIDFGHNSGCMLTVGEMGSGNWVVLDEVYGPGMRPLPPTKNWRDECIRVMRDYGVRDIFGDPEDAGAMFDLRNNGIPIRSANKQVYTGIRRIAGVMHITNGKSGLRIFADRAPNLIREMRNYQWKPNREQTGFLEEPADGQDDHACLHGDTLISTDAGQRRLKDLASSGWFTVLSPEGGRLVRRRACAFITNRSTGAVALSYDSGHLVCTPEHPMWTSRGWVQAKDISRGDALARPHIDYGDPSGLYGRQVLPEPPIEGMGSGARRDPARMARSPQEPRQAGQSAGEFGVSLADQPCHGTRRRNGDQHGDVASQRRGQGVALGTWPQSVGWTAETNENLCGVRLRVPDEVPAQKCQVLPFELQDAGVQSQTSWVRVEVSPAKDCDVYNLYVDGPSHAFVANGLVTHNCDALRYAAMELKLYDFVEAQRFIPGAGPPR